MKKYKLFLLALPVVLFSCNDDAFLEEKPMDFLAPEVAYNTEAGIRQGINGLHYSVRNDFFFGEEIQEHTSTFKSLGTDVAFHGEDPNSTKFPCNFVNYWTSTNTIVVEWWRRPYRIIQRANLIIQYCEKSDDAIWTSAEKRDQFAAEAKFFRAWCYRHLVSTFGDVPVVRDVVSEAKTDFVRDPKSEAFKLMEEDLLAGVASLPDRTKEETPGRITKGAALHLLTEVYLMQQKYNEAVDAATRLINNMGYAIMTSRFGGAGNSVWGTGDVFWDLFARNNQNLADNTENIWSIQFDEPSVIGGSNSRGGRAWGPAYFRMGNTPDGVVAFRGELVNGSYTGYSDTLGRGVSWIRPTYYMSHLVWGDDFYNDIRNAPHMVKRDFYFDNPNSQYHGQKIDFSLYPASANRDPIRDTCQYIYPFFMKFFDPCHVMEAPTTSGNGAAYKDVYAMRLAEVYLFRAEAYIQLGQIDRATEDINVLRRRANATPVTADKVDIDYLLDERARELYQEESRWYVLRRTGKLVERVRRYNNNPLNPGLNIQDYHVLLPIPQNQIDLNIDHEFPQNPGYTK
ncbi:MAG: RagB/SusD family nutrient uptake outer membrane protein [Tannerella sp.]|jgi:hypothetical protein|nr:RagB/SusD family nutrient uptake outer membrane protein [Tannerella sp.]